MHTNNSMKFMLYTVVLLFVTINTSGFEKKSVVMNNFSSSNTKDSRKKIIMSGYRKLDEIDSLMDGNRLQVTFKTGDGKDFEITSKNKTARISIRTKNKKWEHSDYSAMAECNSDLDTVMRYLENTKSGRYFDYNEHFPSYSFEAKTKHTQIICTDCELEINKKMSNNSGTAIVAALSSIYACMEKEMIEKIDKQ